MGSGARGHLVTAPRTTDAAPRLVGQASCGLAPGRPSCRPSVSCLVVPGVAGRPEPHAATQRPQPRDVAHAPAPRGVAGTHLASSSPAGPPRHVLLWSQAPRCVDL